MPSSGLFIVLYDHKTLNLYLERGIYSFLMGYNEGKIGSWSKHYPALADYACGREGTHVFFFIKRKIIYGGQVYGSKKYGAYYLNGSLFPIGAKAQSPLVWDESKRSIYDAAESPGVFTRQIEGDDKERCQPYLLLFKDSLGLRGKAITSDDLYLELGSYGYPLPTNAIQNMSFCTMAPGEVDILLRLMNESTENMFEGTIEPLKIEAPPLPFKPEYGISNPSKAKTEAELEASLLGNPELMPLNLRPKEGWTLGRQIPISPFKPSQMDRADIVYYSEDKINDGTIPNSIIELKHARAGKNEALQIVRYVRWIEKIAPEHLDRISFYMYAPSFTGNITKYIPREYSERIKLVSYEQESHRLEDF